MVDLAGVEIGEPERRPAIDLDLLAIVRVVAISNDSGCVVGHFKCDHGGVGRDRRHPYVGQAERVVVGQRRVVGDPATDVDDSAIRRQGPSDRRALTGCGDQGAVAADVGAAEARVKRPDKDLRLSGDRAKRHGCHDSYN